MSDEKKPLKDLGIDELVDESALPPITDDEVEDPSPSLLSDYLDEIAEDTATRAGNGETGEEGFDYIELELAALEEGSWIEESCEDRELLIEVDIDEQEVSWSEEDAAADSLLEEHWFAEELDHPLEEDGGEEGPIDEEIAQIDQSAWEDLDGWEESEDESVEEMMERLGLTIGHEEEERTPGSVSFHMSVDVQYIGPKGGRAVALTSLGDSLVVVGDGVYMMGADGMVHELATTPEIEATSVVGHREMTYIGTRRNGVVTLTGSDPRLRPLNDWYSLDMQEPVKAGMIETSFSLVGHDLDGRLRLVGTDGSGRIFESLDEGATWKGPLDLGRCLGIAPVGDTPQVIAAFQEGKNLSLRASEDLVSWTHVPISRPMEGFGTGPSMALAAATGTIALAPGEDDTGLFVTLDDGISWREARSLHRVSAVAIDPQDPSWLAAAGRDPGSGLVAVRVSGDGGTTWNTAIILDEEREDEARGERRVEQLKVVSGSHRILYVVETGGVHQVTITSRHTSH